MNREALIVLGLGLAAIMAFSLWPRRRREPVLRSESPPSPSCTSEELWESLERGGVWHAFEDVPSKSGEVVFFEPRRGASCIFPIFSSSELLEPYLTRVVPTYERRVPVDPNEVGATFSVVRSTPDFLGQNTWSSGQLVLDPDTEFERVFSDEDLLYFKQRASPVLPATRVSRAGPAGRMGTTSDRHDG